ncbi:MAG: ROK family protein [Candidatus Nanopelagicales bacterium]
MEAGQESLIAVDSGTVELVRLVREHGPLSRADIGEHTGWARVTVNQRLDRTLDAGLLHTPGTVTSARGRPAAQFAVNAQRAHLLVADIGASGMRLARTDLAGRVQRRVDQQIDIADGPDVVLTAVVEGLGALDEPGTPLWGVGVSVPGPVESATGTVISPPIMTGWDGTCIPRRLGERFGPLIFVDNDVNAMVVGERASVYADVDDLLLIKVGTGVGAGIIANGRTLRGANGSAGDIGHIRADVESDRQAPLCKCGQLGCVEAYAGGWAIMRDLADAGQPVASVDQVVAAVQNGDALATRLVRDAGRVLGSTVADAVGLLNPAVIVIGGQLSATGEHLLAGVRERIYSRSLPLAMRDLHIAASGLAGDSGVLGLAHGVLDRLFTTDHLNAALALG